MDIPDYPPNSEASKTPPPPTPEDKDLKRVIKGEPKVRKKSLGRKFKDTFVAGDSKMAAQYVAFDVLLPAARDMIYEMGSQYLNKLIFGETRRRGTTPPQSGPSGYFNYNRPTAGSRTSGPPWQTSPQRAMSRAARASHNFDEIVIESRLEAEQVIEQLFEVVSRYESASVADLYELVGLASTHTDNKWGWTDFRGAGLSRVRGGYLLDLPEPHPLG